MAAGEQERLVDHEVAELANVRNETKKTLQRACMNVKQAQAGILIKYWSWPTYLT